MTNLIPERRNQRRNLLRWPSPPLPHWGRYSENINWLPYDSNELIALGTFPSIMQVWHAAVTEGSLWSHIYHVGYKENRIWHFCAVYTNIKNWLSSLFKLPPGQWVNFSFDERRMFSLPEMELQVKINVHIYIYIYKSYAANRKKRKRKTNKPERILNCIEKVLTGARELLSGKYYVWLDCRQREYRRVKCFYGISGLPLVRLHYCIAFN